MTKAPSGAPVPAMLFGRLALAGKKIRAASEGGKYVVLLPQSGAAGARSPFVGGRPGVSNLGCDAGRSKPCVNTSTLWSDHRRPVGCLPLTQPATIDIARLPSFGRLLRGPS